MHVVRDASFGTSRPFTDTVSYCCWQSTRFFSTVTSGMLLAGADAKAKESLDRPIVGSLVVLLVFKMIYRSTY